MRAVGMNDEQTICDACGKNELRGTVIVVDNDGNEIGRYGTTCASKIIGRSITRQDAIRSEKIRRNNVISEYRNMKNALSAGNIELAKMYRRDAEKFAFANAKELAQFDAILKGN